jgi:hypothetical protein
VQADRRGKIFSSKARALTRVAGMTEVRMSVDVDETGAFFRGESEAGCNEKTAVASDHEW